MCSILDMGDTHGRTHSKAEFLCSLKPVTQTSYVLPKCNVVVGTGDIFPFPKGEIGKTGVTNCKHVQYSSRQLLVDLKSPEKTSPFDVLGWQCHLHSAAVWHSPFISLWGSHSQDFEWRPSALLKPRQWPNLWNQEGNPCDPWITAEVILSFS